MNKKIRVLIIEDSFLMRKIITDIINSDPDLEVVGEANGGEGVLTKIFEFKPDVVTLDINLPGVSGLDVLSKIVSKKAARVIMLSAYSRPGAAATIKALELGAVDFIAKPSGEVSLDLFKFKDDIISKIKLAAEINPDKFKYNKKESAVLAGIEAKGRLFNKLVVIGASTGGPKAVLEIMQRIDCGLRAAFLIVQHMPLGFTANFAERISWKSGIITKEAEDEDIIEANKAFVAPGGMRMALENYQGKIRIKIRREEAVNFAKPSIDVTMLSAVEIFGKNVIGVILTGMGKDGLEGARMIKKKGGVVIAQDEESSVVWGMPGAVYKAGLADKVLPLSEIAQAIAERI